MNIKWMVRLMDYGTFCGIEKMPDWMVRNLNVRRQK